MLKTIIKSEEQLDTLSWEETTKKVEDEVEAKMAAEEEEEDAFMQPQARVLQRTASSALTLLECNGKVSHMTQSKTTQSSMCRRHARMAWTLPNHSRKKR